MQTAVVDDFELVEMVNLPTSDTGLEGTVYISTAQGSHGPRVKWYPGRPGRTEPCLTVTVDAPPAAINHGLPPRIAEAAAIPVSRWVSLNAAALDDFWNNGASWTRHEVTAFVDRLQKL